MQYERPRFGALDPNDLKVDDSGMEEISVNTGAPVNWHLWLLLAGLLYQALR